MQTEDNKRKRKQTEADRHSRQQVGSEQGRLSGEDRARQKPAGELRSRRLSTYTSLSLLHDKSRADSRQEQTRADKCRQEQSRQEQIKATSVAKRKEAKQ
jgi:hypothetical protein